VVLIDFGEGIRVNKDDGVIDDLRTFCFLLWSERESGRKDGTITCGKIESKLYTKEEDLTVNLFICDFERSESDEHS
jgi:hypothetical protein